MSVLTWLGLVSRSEHRELKREHSQLQQVYAQILVETDDLRKKLDRARSIIDVEAVSRAEVTKMLRQAMDDVTNAVGLAHVLDAAKRKLDMAAEFKHDETNAHVVETAQQPDGGGEVKSLSD